MQELYPRFEGAETEVVGVSTDDLETQQRFAASFGEGLPFPLVADSDKKVTKAYGALNKLGTGASRQIVLIERDGVISYLNRSVEARNEEHYDELLKAAGA